MTRGKQVEVTENECGGGGRQVSLRVTFEQGPRGIRRKEQSGDGQEERPWLSKEETCGL